jgi:hypothetical protein
MRFEEALKAMREGKKVKLRGGEYRYYLKNDVLYRENSDGDEEKLDGSWCTLSIDIVITGEWVVVDDEYYSILKSAEEISPKDFEKLKFEAGPCAIEESKADKIDQIDLKITFIGGGEIVIPDEQWDDYRYDGKFFTIIKDGDDIAMYNAKEVFSLVLVRRGEE